MGPPNDTLWELEPHSRGKHEILRSYAQAWLPIMSSRHGRVVLVDAFAGPGRYLGWEPGSPLILLDAYLNHSYREQMRSEVVYLFIEEREDRVKHLKSEIAALGPLPPNVKVDVQQGSYQDLFRKELEAIQGAGQSLAPTLAFVDPFGYSDAPMDLTGQFLQFKRCEVLVYMPLPFVARFVSRAGQEHALTSLFGTDQWREAVSLQGEARRQRLHDLFRDQLQRNGSRYVRSFEIESGQGNGYHLFFGTNHYLGMAKMKEAMWATDPVTGGRYTDSTESDQLILFEPTVDTGPLLRALRAHFGTRTFSIEEAEEFTVLETAFAASHVRRRTLAPAEKDGLLEAVTPRKQVRTYPKGTRVQRAERMERVLRRIDIAPNIWLGVSVESPQYYSRIRHLSRVDCSVRFLSCEPLLTALEDLPLQGIHWVIVGGESGPGARPMDPAWVTAIRDQCGRSDVPFFFKQWGGVNKKKTGRVLDGRTWDEMPSHGLARTA